jgi:hypothetical protein
MAGHVTATLAQSTPLACGRWTCPTSRECQLLLTTAGKSIRVPVIFVGRLLPEDGFVYWGLRYKLAVTDCNGDAVERCRRAHDLRVS